MSTRAPALRNNYAVNTMHRQVLMPQQYVIPISKADHLYTADLSRYRIRCIQCSRLRSQAQFSETQLARLRWAIAHGTARNSAGTSLICRSCTGSQVTELTCCVCGDTKGLNAFTKAQRRDPDHAVGRAPSVLITRIGTHAFDSAASTALPTTRRRRPFMGTRRTRRRVTMKITFQTTMKMCDKPLIPNTAALTLSSVRIRIRVCGWCSASHIRR